VGWANPPQYAWRKYGSVYSQAAKISYQASFCPVNRDAWGRSGIKTGLTDFIINIITLGYLGCGGDDGIKGLRIRNP